MVQTLLKATWMPDKDGNGPTGPSASQPRHSATAAPTATTQGTGDGGLAHLGTWPANQLHQCRGLRALRLRGSAFSAPFPYTFQKYCCHSAPARAAGKTLGSATRKPAQATPAQPEIPPSPVASPCDPISPRSPGQLWCVQNVITQSGRGRETDHPFPSTQPASSHPPHPLAR